MNQIICADTTKSLFGISRWPWKIMKPSGWGPNRKIWLKEPKVLCRKSHFKNEYVSSTGNMNCSQFNVGFMSRKGARFGSGSESLGLGVFVNSLSCVFNKVFLSVNRNLRRCDSNCAISLMISLNPAEQVSSQSHSCGHAGSMLLCKFCAVVAAFYCPPWE